MNGTVNEHTVNLATIETKLEEMKDEVGEHFGIVEEDMKGHELRLDDLKVEDERLDQEVHKKEDKVEVERVIKAMENMQERNVGLEADMRLQQHKIEKMEILGEKAERMKAKKDIEFFKEIEERVKKEVKVALKGGTNGTSSSTSGKTSDPNNSNKSKVFVNNSPPVRKDPFSDIAEDEFEEA